MKLVLHSRAVTAALVAAVSLVLVLTVAPRAQAAAPDDSWSAVPASTDTTPWREVVWSPSLKLFVAVANTASIMTSSDGVTWSAPITTPQVLRGVAWSPPLGRFVAVGGSGEILTSDDGVVWTPRTNPNGTGGIMADVTWAADVGAGEFVAVTSLGVVMSSPDGITWTIIAPFGTGPHNIVNLIRANGLFVTVSNSPVTPGVSTSVDGVAWTSTSTASLAGVAYSPTKGFVVVGTTAGVQTSSDGVTWTAQTSPATKPVAVTWSPEQSEFVAAGTGGIISSPDGATWTSSTNLAAGNGWNSIAWSPELAEYVGVALSGTNRVLVGLVPPTITTTALSAGKVGTVYSATIATTGAPASTFAVTTGILPAGLTLDPATGAITGKPTTAGSSTFTITASRTLGGITVTATMTYTIAVAAAASTAASGPTLPATGVEAAPVLLVGGGIVLLGLLAVAVSLVLRRRKAATGEL